MSSMAKFSFWWKMETLVCMCLGSAYNLGLAVVVSRGPFGLGKAQSGGTYTFS